MLHHISSGFQKFCVFFFFNCPFSGLFLPVKWSNFYWIHFKLGRGPYGCKTKSSSNMGYLTQKRTQNDPGIGQFRHFAFLLHQKSFFVLFYGNLGYKFLLTCFITYVPGFRNFANLNF